MTHDGLWLTAQQLAGLPGMPTTDRGAKMWAEKNLPVFRRKLRGKGLEYRIDLDRLPAGADRAAFLLAASQRAGVVADADAAPVPVTHPGAADDPAGALIVEPGAGGLAERRAEADADLLNAHQREVRAARRQIREFVEAYPGSVKGALIHLNLLQADGLLPRALAWAYAHCHDKRRAGQQLKPKTYYNWLDEERTRGSLAPKKRPRDFRVRSWHEAAIALKRRPQGSQLTWIVAQLQAAGHAVSYHQAYRFFRDKFSCRDQERHTGSQLRARRFYQHRTAEGLAPADEVHADGWNSHFTAPHPVTGEFVTYEIWHFHDVATRYVTPPGIGLTEQFEVIAKGLENYIRLFGRPLIVQTDSTKIVRGSDRFTKALHSLEERIGCTIVHPKQVGNSQANGICENFNTSWLDKQARALATYQNPKQMDDLTFKRVKKLTTEMVRAANAGDAALVMKKRLEAARMGHGLVFGSAEEAIGWIHAAIEAYNDKPHRALKKLRDAATGKLRHQTPREALAEHLAHGWAPVAVDEEELIDLFRPHRVVRVARETVSPYGGMRFRDPALQHWNGKDVVVAYDIHDWRRVWVKDMKGELICEAEFVAASGYRAQTAYEAAEEKRAKARIAALKRKEKAIRARTGLGDEIEHAQVITLPVNPSPREELIDARDVIGPIEPPKREALRSARDVLAEMDAKNPPPQVERVKEGTWEDTKTMLFVPEDKPVPPEEAAAR